MGNTQVKSWTSKLRSSVRECVVINELLKIYKGGKRETPAKYNCAAFSLFDLISNRHICNDTVHQFP